MDRWAPYAKLVRDHPVHAQIWFDRFHIVQHLHEVVDAARRELWRQLSTKERASFKGTRWPLLKNPWNLNHDPKDRLSTWVAGTRRWSALGTARNPFNCSGAISSRGGPSHTC